MKTSKSRRSTKRWIKLVRRHAASLSAAALHKAEVVFGYRSLDGMVTVSRLVVEARDYERAVKEFDRLFPEHEGDGTVEPA